MQTYEINLWQDKKIVEKVVKQFKDDDEVLKFIAEHFDKEEELPRLDAEAGYLRPKKSDVIITWSKIRNNGYWQRYWHKEKRINT